MLKRASVVVPVVVFASALGACAAPSEYDGPVPTPTRSSTVAFGTTATLVTRDVRFGVPVAWEVTVAKPKRVRDMSCYAVTLTPVEVGEFPMDVTVPVPVIETSFGEFKANFFEDTSACKLDDVPPHGYTPDLKGKPEFVAVVASTDATGVRVRTLDTQVTWEPTESLPAGS